MSTVSTSKDDRKNIVKALKSIICITSSQINENIIKMIKDLELPVIGVHLTETYVAKTIEENKGQRELDIYAAVFNSRGNDMFRIFINLQDLKLKTENNVLICVLNESICDTNKTNTVLFSNDDNSTKYKQIKSSIKNHRTYCIYALRLYEDSNTIHRIIDALKNHINKEYKPSNELFVGFIRQSHSLINNRNDSFINDFITALSYTFINPNPGYELLYEQQNVIGLKGIDPTYFKSKKGNCQLKLFYMADNQSIYQPFPKDFYFPRFTLDNAEQPQVHILCFAVVKYPISKCHDQKSKYQWNIVALRNCEPNLTANHVITNAYALMYIGQDYKLSKKQSLQNLQVKAFENLDDSDQLKNKLNTQLLQYYNDARLKNLGNLIKDWRNTGKLYTSM